MRVIQRRQKRRKVHRIAYELTYGIIPEGMCVMHRCRNSSCCNPAHLLLGTRSEVSRHRRGGGFPVGAANIHAKLTAEEVQQIRELAVTGRTYEAIGREFGVYFGHVGKIVRGEARWLDG